MERWQRIPALFPRVPERHQWISVEGLQHLFELLAVLDLRRQLFEGLRLVGLGLLGLGRLLGQLNELVLGFGQLLFERAAIVLGGGSVIQDQHGLGPSTVAVAELRFQGTIAFVEPRMRVTRLGGPAEQQNDLILDVDPREVVVLLRLNGVSDEDDLRVERSRLRERAGAECLVDLQRRLRPRRVGNFEGVPRFELRPIRDLELLERIAVVDRDVQPRRAEDPLDIDGCLVESLGPDPASLELIRSQHAHILE